MTRLVSDRSQLPALFRTVCGIAFNDAAVQAQDVEEQYGRPLLRTESFRVDEMEELAELLATLCSIDDQALVIRLYTGVRRQCTIALADLGRMSREEQTKAR